MGIFQTIKNKLGIGGVKVRIQAPGQVAISDGLIKGSFSLTTKSDQELKSARVTVYEEFTTGRGDNKKTKKFDLGVIDVVVSKNIKKGEEQKYKFEVPFELIKSDADELKEKGGVMGKIGGLSKFANNEKSEYFVKAEVDVASAAIDPWDYQAIKMM